MATFDDVPDEILEYIVGLVSPYNDLAACKVVCKKWNSAVKRVILHKQGNLFKAIKNNNLVWEYENCLGVSFRHTHAACYYDGTMFVYGGFSKSTTTFNDLMAFNLTTRKWKRMLTTGSFPSPKAATSLIAHNGKLILFGGCAHPSSMTPFQPLIVFKELHVFDIATNAWTSHALTENRPPSCAHAATIHGNDMVTYGGLTTVEGQNDNLIQTVYCLDLTTMTWRTPHVSKSPRPPGLFGHSQVFIDDTHLLIIGGRCKDSNSTAGAWLLTMGQEPWQWTHLNIENTQWSPPKLWCIPIVRVNRYLVAFSKSSEDAPVRIVQEDRVPNVRPRPEENVNGRRGYLQRNQVHADPEQPLAGPAHHIPRNERRRHQLSLLERYHKKYNAEKRTVPREVTVPSMNLYAADIDEILTNNRITWQEPRYSAGCPGERILFTLLLGNSELIMLGGLMPGEQTEENRSDVQLATMHSLAFAKPPRFLL